MNKVKAGFDKVVEWDRNLAKKFQDKFNLTDYQMLCVSVSYTHLTLPTILLV